MLAAFLPPYPFVPKLHLIFGAITVYFVSGLMNLLSLLPGVIMSGLLVIGKVAGNVIMQYNLGWDIPCQLMPCLSNIIMHG